MACLFGCLIARLMLCLFDRSINDLLVDRLAICLICLLTDCLNLGLMDCLIVWGWSLVRLYRWLLEGSFVRVFDCLIVGLIGVSLICY